MWQIYDMLRKGTVIQAARLDCGARKQMKKVELTKKLIESNSSLFMCPLCGKRMSFIKANSLLCQNKHNFDISKDGYINLLVKQVKSDYDRNMFESRKAIIQNGFFDPMLRVIGDLILEGNLNNSIPKSKILDAGCGEGSHLISIISNLAKLNICSLGIGIDISKEGIRAASKQYANIIWCVADLSNIPFQNNQFDIILNILSPANYSEFERVLKTGGLLIKVVPGMKYLIELRDVLFKGTSKQTYSNDRVINRFDDNFGIVYNQQVIYNVYLNNENIEHLINMTPLTWNADREKIAELIAMNITRITVAFDVVVGQKRR